MPWRSRIACTVLRNTVSRWGERCPAAVSAAAIAWPRAPARARVTISASISRLRDRSESEPPVTGRGLTRRAPAPDNTHGDGVPGGTVDDNLVDQAAQERLLPRCGQDGLAPQVRQAPADLGEGGLEIGADHERDDATGVLPRVGERGFGLAQVAQCLLPTPLEFGGDQTVVRIDLIELPLGQGGSVAQPLNLLRLSLERRLLGRVPDRHGLCEDLEFGGGKCLEERRHRLGIDRIGLDVLAHRNAGLLAKV